MNDCARVDEGGHSIRRILPVALLLSFPAAWAQETPPPQPSTATPVAPAAQGDEKKDKPADPQPPIDLYLRSARELLPQSQWDTLVATQPTDPAEEGDLPALGHEEEVQVEGSKPAPKVPDGIAGLFWAMRHPTQAWRIFVPAPTD